ncbi:glycoside hydrolase family 38 N-terminal domain-containing protein [Carnobacterium gallinarum]|uniref:glycoside hydrolase family 38 N-terminal domain-containing protein n=1 Tax=Carnobacterium gallinarum TaxID=2749 RepID=UPI000B2CD3EE|nr:hypothetical protein [Carnobacterium gallinarum]
MQKKWKLYLINHSHTDIGYTDRQEKIERYHVDFIKQAIDILDDIESGVKKEWQGYKWTCENYWQVENFYANANEEYRQKFEKYTKLGLIDISLNYLNMTELVDETILNKMLKRGRDYADHHQVSLDSGMTADINGFAWGYSEALYQNGIQNLFSCLHAHHGIQPLYTKQRPFWWQSPQGNKILVWNGEHYQLGNEFLLIPNTRMSYHIQDEFVNDPYTDQFEITENRIYRYLDNLEKEGYEYDFVPAMISGLMSDNAAPNGHLMETIMRWNQKHGDNVEIELTTLTHFFDVLRQQNDSAIPTYSGDWADWWADGVGSTPAPTKIYREAQRKYQLSQKLDPDMQLGKSELVKQAEEQLMMYAEHTWGFSSSVSEPWNTLVNDLDFRKAAYAVNGNQAISRNLDEVLSKLGEVSIRPNREKLFKIINPHGNKITDQAKIYIEYWEDVEGDFFGTKLDGFIEVVEVKSGRILASQVARTARAMEIEFIIELAAHEERIVKVRRVQAIPARTAESYAHVGSEGVEDLASYAGYQAPNNTYLVETDAYRIELDHQVGIKSLVDKQNNQELIHADVEYAPFVGVYEKTPVKTDPCDERRRMGRNRKGRITERSSAKLTNVEKIADGSVYTTIKLDYQLTGTNLYSVLLKVYKTIPKIAATVRIQKQNEWAPENLYIPLPFSLGDESELFIEKTGAVLRPGIDQLPGTNTDFYSLQSGLAFKKDNQALLVAIQDTPLITLGNLEHHLIELSGAQTHQKNHELVYSWVMNNFWETNFKVDLSGFYEFDYQLYATNQLKTEQQMLEKCQELNEGLLAFPI